MSSPFLIWGIVSMQVCTRGIWSYQSNLWNRSGSMVLLLKLLVLRCRRMYCTKLEVESRILNRETWTVMNMSLAVRVYPTEKAFRCSSCSQSCSCVSVDRCRKMRKVVSVRKGEKDERREQTSIISNKQMWSTVKCSNVPELEEKFLLWYCKSRYWLRYWDAAQS